MTHNIIKTIAVLALGAMLMSGCEKIHTDELTINNQSGHNVVIEYATVMRPHSIGGFELGWTDIIPTDSSVVVFSAEDNGYTGKEDSEKEIVKWFFGDSLTFIVDGTYRYTYHSSDTLTNNSPYNFNSPFYLYTESGQTYTNHTFTITAEQLSPLP